MPLVKTPGASEVQRRDDGGGRKPLELAFRGGGGRSFLRGTSRGAFLRGPRRLEVLQPSPRPHWLCFSGRGGTRKRRSGPEGR